MRKRLCTRQCLLCHFASPQLGSRPWQSGPPNLNHSDRKDCLLGDDNGNGGDVIKLSIVLVRTAASCCTSSGAFNHAQSHTARGRPRFSHLSRMLKSSYHELYVRFSFPSPSGTTQKLAVWLNQYRSFTLLDWFSSTFGEKGSYRHYTE